MLCKDDLAKPKRWSNVKLTQEQYIAKARAKWGDAYDYSESVYLAGLKPITIRCKKHNHYFTVQAGNHISTRLKSGGCPLCGQESLTEYRRKKHEEALKKAEQKKKVYKPRLTHKERFLKKARAMYPDYDFSRVEYKDRETYIVVVCPVHGEFKIRPRTLLIGEKGQKPHGCWKCNNLIPPYEKELTLDTFKSRMHELYGDKYAFVWSDYKNKRSMIRFTCKEHGEQRRSVTGLLDGKGCAYCNGKFYSPDWIKNARAVHGEKYEYDESRPPRITSDYIRYKCPVHGWQETRYDCHVQQGCGCALCAGVQTQLPAEDRKQIWIKKCMERFPGKFSYRDVVYINNDTPVKIYCKEHHLTFVEFIECFRISHKKAMADDLFRRIFILLLIQSIRTSKIRNITFCRYSRSAKKYNILAVINNVLQFPYFLFIHCASSYTDWFACSIQEITSSRLSISAVIPTFTSSGTTIISGMWMIYPPALFPASTPAILSSRTRHSSIGRCSSSAAFKKISGFGLLLSTLFP